MKFLIDMPLPPSLALWLVQRGHDAVHVSDVGLATAADQVVMQQAKQDRRTIVTADLDYPRLLALAGATAPSLILFRGGNWSDAAVVAKMDALLSTINDTEIQTSIVVIESDRVRRRRLPIR